MAQIELAPEIADDFGRIVDHLAKHSLAAAPERIAEIIEALDLLARHPQIGRPLSGGLRELVMGRGSRSYLALYRYAESIDTVFVLTIRSQRELGYARQ